MAILVDVAIGLLVLVVAAFIGSLAYKIYKGQ